MKKREWIYILLPLFLVWFLDAATKQWALSLTKILSFKYVHFVVSHNHGAFLGLFSNLPALLRIVTLSTFGAFLVFGFAVLQYILPIRSMKLRIGSSILVGGIIGNVFDRVRWGYVVDFIIIGKEKVLMSPPFNVADMLQWVGYFLICLAVIKDGNLLWPTENSRKNVWIDPKYQYRYIWLLVIMTTSVSLIAGVFAFTFLRVTIIELIGKNNFILSKFMIPFIGTYIVINLSFCLFLVLVGRVISHRTAGPIYAFQKYIIGLFNGEDRPFKLRTADEFKQLEKLALLIKENVQLQAQLKAQVQELEKTNNAKSNVVVTNNVVTSDVVNNDIVPNDGVIKDVIVQEENKNDISKIESESPIQEINKDELVRQDSIEKEIVSENKNNTNQDIVEIINTKNEFTENSQKDEKIESKKDESLNDLVEDIKSKAVEIASSIDSEDVKDKNDNQGQIENDDNRQNTEFEPPDISTIDELLKIDSDLNNLIKKGS